jgi:FG-GAP-like repeat
MVKFPIAQFRATRQGLKSRVRSYRPCLELLESRVLLASIQLSGATPFSNTADIIGQSGTVWLNSGVEPEFAVDPANPRHIVGIWQQDRWSNGGSRGIMTAVTFDGGNSWQTTPLPGASVNSGGITRRASNPWVTIATNGTVYASCLTLNDPALGPPHAVVVSVSTNGGISWSGARAIVTNTSPLLFNDKDAITADPTNPNFAYVVWDRLNSGAIPTEGPGPTLFSETTNGGLTWSAPVDIFDPPDGQTISNQIVVLPNGTLVNMFVQINYANNAEAIEIIESANKGATWSGPIVVAALTSTDTFDPNNGQPVRSADVIPEIAVDLRSGALYVVWQDSRFSNGAHDDIAFSQSTDGGATWTAPVRVNETPPRLPAGDEQAFSPAIAVSQSGAIAVRYYDFRDNSGTGGLLTDAWAVFARPSPHPQFTQELRLTAASFNLELAPFANGYFLGDYESLVAGGANAYSFSAISSITISPTIAAAIFFSPNLQERGLDGYVVTGADVGGGPEVKAFDAATGALQFDFLAYSPLFTGGVRVAVADVSGDGIPDIITAPGAGGGPDVRVFDGTSGRQIDGFYAFSRLFSGGVYVAVGDFNRDGFADIVTAADAGGGPQVKVFDGRTLTYAHTAVAVASFYAYSRFFTGGVRVAVGDINGDGIPDLITAPGVGGGPDVRVFNGAALNTASPTADIMREFYAFSPSLLGGVFVAAGDANGDGLADILCGTGPTTPSLTAIALFSGATGGLLYEAAPSISVTGGAAPALHVAMLRTPGFVRSDMV